MSETKPVKIPTWQPSSLISLSRNSPSHRWNLIYSDFNFKFQMAPGGARGPPPPSPPHTHPAFRFAPPPPGDGEGTNLIEMLGGVRVQGVGGGEERNAPPGTSFEIKLKSNKFHKSAEPCNLSLSGR